MPARDRLPEPAQPTWICTRLIHPGRLTHIAGPAPMEFLLDMMRITILTTCSLSDEAGPRRFHGKRKPRDAGLFPVGRRVATRYG